MCVHVVIWWCFLCVFFHLMLAGRQPFGILRWFFSCFVSFIWCQLFACLIRAAIFRLPPAFMVWSFFLCHRHLWSVLSFFATGICVQSQSFMAFSAVGIRVILFCLCLHVSACFRVSVYLSVFVIMLCACCSSASSLEIRTGILSKSVTLWTALQIPL